MHMYDLIEKKKRGGALSRAELDGLVAGAVSGDIPDVRPIAAVSMCCR